MSKKRRGDAPEFRAGEWLKGDGPQSDIAICTRVRLARNLQGFRFAPVLDSDESKQLTDFVVEKLQQPGLPEELAVGVNVAEYDVPEPVKLVSVPPDLVTSPSAKLLDAAESVKVISAVSLPPRVALLETTVTVGAWVLTAIDVAPSAFALPLASVNLPAATVMAAAPVTDAAGVNVAV